MCLMRQDDPTLRDNLEDQATEGNFLWTRWVVQKDVPPGFFVFVFVLEAYL